MHYNKIKRINNLFSGRPLLMLSAAFIIALRLCTKANKPASVFMLCAGFLLLSLIAALILIRKNRKEAVKVLAVLALGVSIALAISARNYFSGEKKAAYYEGKEAFVTGTIYSAEAEKYGYSAVCSVETIDTTPASFKINVLVFGNFDTPSYGDLFTGTVAFDEFSSSLYGFDYKTYYKADGILLRGSSTDFKTTAGNAGTIHKTVKNIQDFFSSKLDKLNYSGIAKASLIGQRGNIPKELNEALYYTGTTHLISISGLHVTLILSFMYLICDFFGIPKKIKCISVCFLALFYMMLCGFAPSVTRAGIMAVLFYLSMLAKRKNDPPTTLFASVMLICLFNPYSVLDTGLLLSFSSTLGIITAGQAFIKYVKEGFSDTKRKNIFIALSKKLFLFLISSVAVSVSAIFFSLPFVFLNFDAFCVASPLFNLILIPLFEIPLILGALSLCFSVLAGNFAFLNPFWSFISEILGKLTDFGFSFFEKCAILLAKPRLGVIRINYPFAAGMSLIVVLLICVFFIIRPKPKYYLYAPIAFALIFCIFSSGYRILNIDNTELFCVDSYSDKRLVIKSPKTSVVLDGVSEGNKKSYDYFSEITEKEFISVINAYIFPSYYGNMASRLYLIKPDIERIFVPKPLCESDEALYSVIEELCRDKNINLTAVDYGTELYFEDIAVSFFSSSGKGAYYRININDITVLYINNLSKLNYPLYKQDKDTDIYIKCGHSEKVFDENTLNSKFYAFDFMEYERDYPGYSDFFLKKHKNQNSSCHVLNTHDYNAFYLKLSKTGIKSIKY